MPTVVVGLRHSETRVGARPALSGRISTIRSLSDRTDGPVVDIDVEEDGGIDVGVAAAIGAGVGIGVGGPVEGGVGASSAEFPASASCAAARSFTVSTLLDGMGVGRCGSTMSVPLDK